MKTNEIIYAMLTENTGKHFLDSGGTDGRMWQRNQHKTIEDFESEDAETYELCKYGDDYELIRTVSVYHYLKDLETDEICDEFNKLQDEHDNWDADCEAYGVSQEAWEFLEALYDVEIDRVWNTYNGESDLSQVLQGANLTINDEQYILIQVHGGADVRGGYTDAKLFKLNDDGLIHEYLMEFMDSYDLDYELQYIDKVWFEGELIEFTDELKQKIK